MSAGLACIVIMTAVILSIKITWDFVVVIYLLSLAPCLFGRYYDLKEDAETNPERSKYLRNKAKKIPYVIILITLIMLSIMIYYGRYLMIIFAVVLVLASFLYDVFLKKLTRVIIGFKNIYIGCIFTSLIFMMAICYNYKISLAFILVAIYVFIMSVMGAAFCDIKDLEGDKKEELKTYAVVFGPKKLIKYLCASIIAALIPIVFGVYYKIIPSFALMLCLVLPYNIFLFLESKKEKVNADFLYGAAFDSQLIWWLVFILAGRLIFP